MQLPHTNTCDRVRLLGVTVATDLTLDSRVQGLQDILLLAVTAETSP